jgi:hypothetical protein
MANGESEFAKLLRDAPMASDTITVTGILARTHDPEHFILTLPDGRSVTLPVRTVKSARALAGAIGQQVVQLEMARKDLPGGLGGSSDGLNVTIKEVHGDSTGAAVAEVSTWPWQSEGKNPFEGGKAGQSDQGGWPITGVGGGPFAPFVAAMPHQASRETIAALHSPHYVTRTYYSAYDWTTDNHTVMKAHADQT